MRILYYDWDEFNGEDCRDAMRRLGYQVDIQKSFKNKYDVTPEIKKALFDRFDTAEKEGKPYDLVFTFNFFMNVSDICQERGMKYVAWIFDSPHNPLQSKSVRNSVNRVFVFDPAIYDEMRQQGIETVRFSTLAVNSERLQKLCEEIDAETDGIKVYLHDVSFLGTLYDNEFNFYDQITTLPPELKAYIDAVISAQEKVLGIDLFSNEKLVNMDHLMSIRNYVEFENSGKVDFDYDKVLMDILRKKVTVNERRHILERMGQNFNTALYTQGDIRPIDGVVNLGVANYMKKMPTVFRRSKVNLNITLRTIREGIPLRVLDVLGAGGFLITGYQKGIAERFEDGKDLVMAQTPEDMVAKVQYYLDHDEEREEIARNGQRKVLEDYSYTKLLPEILGV